jgi:hypothetical protein
VRTNGLIRGLGNRHAGSRSWNAFHPKDSRWLRRFSH